MTALPAPMICPSCGAPNERGSSVCRNCTFVLVALPQVHAGFVLASRYEITCALGAGGMGIVYQAQDRLLNETVALKVLRPEVATTPDMAQRFISEIKMARAVSHRNVCRIHEYGEDRGLRYISMAFVGGVDLRRLLRERGPLPPALAFEVAIQATEGLAAVHEEGIVHRDLKPANITVDPRGVVRVMDFGLAKQSTLGADLSSGSAGQMVGTPEYMSPEQIRGARLDRRSDVYSMGIVVYELFTGRTPFRADTAVTTILKHLSEPPPLDGVEALPAAVLPVLKKALQKEPGLRYSSAEALRRAIHEARSSTVGAADADFASFFRGCEPAGPADPAQASHPAWSSEGLSQATWTTAVGRSVVEAVEAGAPFFRVEGVANPQEAQPSAGAVEQPPDPKVRELEGSGPGSGIAFRPSPASPMAEPIPTPAPAAGAPTPVPRSPIHGTQVSGDSAAPVSPVARRRPDETARPTALPGRANVTLEGRPPGTPALASTPWARVAGVVRANPRHALIAAAVPVAMLIALGVLRLVTPPHVSGAEPLRVATGGTVVLTGTGFSAQADGSEVLFSGQPGRVIEASPTRLAAELPELDFSWPEPERRVSVVVHVGRRRSAPFDLTVYQFPRIRSLSPAAGIPGDTVTINGSGWPLAASVRFGRVEAQIVEPGYKSITVRVPAVRAGASGSVPVVVVAGQAVSSPVRFRVGRAQP